MKRLQPAQADRKCLARIDGVEYVGEIVGSQQRVYERHQADAIPYGTSWAKTANGYKAIPVTLSRSATGNVTLPSVFEIYWYGQ